MSKKWQKGKPMTQPPVPVGANRVASDEPPGLVADGRKTELDLLDFLWKTHSYQNEYIRFADTKASVVLALSTGLLGALVAANVQHWLSPSRLALADPVWKDTWPGVGAFVAFAFLVAAFCCAILALSPRLWTTELAGFTNTLRHMFYVKTPPAVPAPGYMFWGEVLAHGSAPNYRAALEQLDATKAREHLATRIYTLSGIANAKYFYINRAIFFALLGAVVACVFVISAPKQDRGADLQSGQRQAAVGSTF